MRTDDERDSSLCGRSEDFGRRAEWSDDRGDENAGIDYESTQLRGRRVALGAEGV